MSICNGVIMAYTDTRIRELLEFYKKVEREVYLDLENSAPIPDEVLEAMYPYFNKIGYGNPTLTHKPGWEAYEAIMRSASIIASYINASGPEEINFTPGETEANNLAIMGTALANKKPDANIVISDIEPLSVLNVAGLLTKFGFKVNLVSVDSEGFVNLEELANLVNKNTILVSIMTVNHEIGTIEPIEEIVKIVKEKNPGTIVHTDASDAYGRIPIDVKKLNVDLLTVSSYKILGPRGVGALYVREGTRIERILEGAIGTQRLWPGVENTPLIVGFAKASELAFTNFEKNVSHMRRLRDELINGILNSVSGTILNGPMGDKRAPDNVNISVLRCEGEALTLELSLRGIYVSSGSACTRRLLVPSHVLQAIGRGYEVAHGSILMKVTRYHTMDDVRYVLEEFPKAVERLRSLSPW